MFNGLEGEANIRQSYLHYQIYWKRGQLNPSINMYSFIRCLGLFVLLYEVDFIVDVIRLDNMFLELKTSSNQNTIQSRYMF